VSAIQERALTVLSNLLKKQGFRAVKPIFSCLNTQPIGPTTPGRITRRLPVNRKKAATAALGKLLRPSDLRVPSAARLSRNSSSIRRRLIKLESRAGTGY
jgi:hypothetical protein